MKKTRAGRRTAPSASTSLASAREYAENIINTLSTPLVVLDADLRVESVNRAFYRTFGVTEADTLGKFIYELGTRQWDIPEFRELLEEILPQRHTIEDFLVERDFERVGRRSMLINARRMYTSDGTHNRIVMSIEDITIRRQIEAKLRDTEQRFTRFMEQLPGLAWIKDADGRYVYANDAAERAFRARRSELYGKFDHDIFPPETAARFVANDRKALNDGSIQAIETLADDAGVVRQSIVSKFSIPGSAGDAALVGGVAIDITDLKETEAALRDSEQRYRSLFASIDEGFCVIEKVEGDPGDPLDFRYVEANPAFSAHTGMNEVVGKTIRQAFPGEDEAWFRTYDAVLRTGESMRFERDLVTQGRVLELYAFRIDDDGHRRVAVIFKDITARKRAEKAQATLAAIVASSDDAIVSKDLNGVITSWNRGAERLFGYSAGEAVGQSITLLIPPDRFAEEDLILERIRRGEAVEHFETVRRRKDGTLFDVSVTVSPIRNNLGAVVGASKIARDVTDRKKTEEALRESDRRKNEFLAMLAHELRNPLAPILLSIEILRRTAKSEWEDEQGQRVDHTIDVLQRQVAQMVRLVDDLLDAGRISRGKIGLRPERVELSSVVCHVVDAARPIAEGRGQELTVTLPSVPVYLDADPTRLGQIVGNLLNNACKFTERGGHIWLTVEREGDAGAGGADGASTPASHVVITVRDTGIGIAADQLEHVFEMFAQVDRSLERSLSGLGIGLTLVKTLTELHGGTVEVRSDGVGRGAEFVVRLPTAAGPAAPGPQPAVTPSGPTAPLRILVVDDNHDSADMLAMLLRSAGHETFTEHDGLAAVEAAAALDPDVILLDVGLPVLNGYEAARRIRARPGQKVRPLLVAVTGWGQQEDRRRSEEAGFDAHLVKPVDDAILRAVLAGLGVRRQAMRD